MGTWTEFVGGGKISRLKNLGMHQPAQSTNGQGNMPSLLGDSQTGLELA